MFTFTGLIIGLVMVGLGILGLKFTFWLHNVTGPVGFIEKYTGSGSTYGIYKIGSVFLIIIGVLWATGFGHNIMEFILSPFNSVFSLGKNSS